MSATTQVEKDLIDRIADALPAEVRADYYRELRHCRSLPENDEMLRILRAMQFLTLLIQGAPSRLAAERGELDSALRECADALLATTERLNALPGEVAGGISPDAIAAKINESLRQQFLQSTIPQTGESLAVVAARMKRVVADFQQASAAVGMVHRSAAAETDQAVRRIESSVRSALSASEEATKALTTTFLQEYRWSIAMIAAVAIVTGMVLGIAFEKWRMSSTREEPAAVFQGPTTKSKR